MSLKPNTSKLQCDTLIIGAGPVGVALGCLLAREGVSVIVCEASHEVYPLPRAAHIDHETMRLFQNIGIMHEVLHHTRPVPAYEFLTAKRETLMRFDMPIDKSPSAWPTSNMIHQPPIEEALRRKLTSYENAELRLGWRFKSHHENRDHVSAKFQTVEGERSISARYLIGADGGSSPVREAAGIQLFDYDFEEPWLVIDTIVKDHGRLPKVNLQICDPKRPTTCVLMGPGRHRWEFMLKPDETSEQVLDEAFIHELLEPWKVEGAVEIERKAVYRFHALIAKDWRKGRVLLAGDAGHQMPPFAGQGLCSGLRDAWNLGWKLGLICKGEADHALLNTYQSEREPHVRSIIDIALMMGKTVCILDEEAAAERDVKMVQQFKEGGASSGGISYAPISEGCILIGSAGAGELFPQPYSGDLRLDDILGRGAWLIERSAIQKPHLQPFASDLKRWFDKKDVAAVLIRPDRYVFGTGEAEKLKDAYPGTVNLKAH